MSVLAAGLVTDRCALARFIDDELAKIWPRGRRGGSGGAGRC
ncbi:hypothetical protein ACFYR1_16380 [Streptomyces canus]